MGHLILVCVRIKVSLIILLRIAVYLVSGFEVENHYISVTVSISVVDVYDEGLEEVAAKENHSAEAVYEVSGLGNLVKERHNLVSEHRTLVIVLYKAKVMRDNLD